MSCFRQSDYDSHFCFYCLTSERILLDYLLRNSRTERLLTSGLGLSVVRSPMIKRWVNQYLIIKLCRKQSIAGITGYYFGSDLRPKSSHLTLNLMEPHSCLLSLLKWNALAHLASALCLFLMRSWMKVKPIAVLLVRRATKTRLANVLSRVADVIKAL